MDSILENLTAEQLVAVTHVNGPMLVVAGAGSGKTRVVTRRIAYLISQGIWADRILTMTFTNKAASEMKERIAELTGITPRWMGTFHSICARLLRRDIVALNVGRTGSFTIFDTADQKSLLKVCMKEIGLDLKLLKVKDVQAKISRAKSDGISPEDFCDTYSRSYAVHDMGLIYKMYEQNLRKMNGLDFDDLLIMTVLLLREVRDVRLKYNRMFSHILVDEYQDTNRIQYALLQLLAGENKNLHVTGDPDQSIYSWRGADYSNIMNFTRDFKGVKVVHLEKNYRSTKTILQASNMLISHNGHRIEKNLYTDNVQGDAILLKRFRSDREEADWVVRKIGRLYSEDGVSLSEIAIFYRTNALSRAFEEYFGKYLIPYQIVGGTRFYERKEVKDMLSYLRIVVNSRDLVSLRRVLSSRSFGIGKVTLERLILQASAYNCSLLEFLLRDDFRDLYEGKLSKKVVDFVSWYRDLVALGAGKVVSDVVYSIIEHSGLLKHLKSKLHSDPSVEDRIANINELYNRATEFSKKNSEVDLAGFLEEVALIADVDSMDDNSSAVSLMSLHSSKGLEFLRVFIVGVEENILPHKNCLEDSKSLEEERRLLYVGITRAKEHVVLCSCMSRFQWGENISSSPSRFIDELGLVDDKKADKKKESLGNELEYEYEEEEDTNWDW